MPSQRTSRRKVLYGAGAALALGAAQAASGQASAAPKRPKAEPFGYCLNTSTLRGQNLSLEEEIEIASKAGYHAIEPWIGEIDGYVKKGGSLADLRRRIGDSGLTVESAIGFFEWIVDDDARRAKALDEAKRNMDLLAQIGGQRIAAPPMGATDRVTDLNRAAERYRALLEWGDRTGVVPQAEVWGFSKTLGRLGDAAFIAIESHHPNACILADVFHLYKGGSDFDSLRLLNGASMHVLHVNDYPALPPREKIDDSARVYPGDGVAPLDRILLRLRDVGYTGVLSLELFNAGYWKQDPLTVARTGLQKIRSVVRRSLSA